MKGKGRIGMKVSGNPDVFMEAAKKTGTKKKGGRVKSGFMTGGTVRPRLDRPGRKTGGAVGSNSKPLSTAHKGYKDGGGVGMKIGADTSPISTAKTGSMSADGSSDPKDTYKYHSD